MLKNITRKVLSIVFGEGDVWQKAWMNRQIKEELAFWKEPTKFESLEGYASIKEKYLEINKNMFKDLKIDFKNRIVCEIGCGPYGGLLPIVKAKCKIGIDPLANEYRKINVEPDIIMLNCMGEALPFCDESIDGCFCINTLDHTLAPSKVLEEIFRVLKKRGYLALAVDIGGAPHHPHLILEKDLDSVLKKRFSIIQRECSDQIKSSWPTSLKIPVYVFQGVKR